MNSLLGRRSYQSLHIQTIAKMNALTMKSTIGGQRLSTSVREAASQLSSFYAVSFENDTSRAFCDHNAGVLDGAIWFKVPMAPSVVACVELDRISACASVAPFFRGFGSIRATSAIIDNVSAIRWSGAI